MDGNAIWRSNAQIAPHVTRTGEAVTILRSLTLEEADLDETGPMYRCAFADGIEIDAFEDELTPA